jgi:phage terminase small subunit
MPRKKVERLPKPGGLNERQERFVREYLKDPDATKAALAAGYAPARAKEQGYQQLHHPAIVAAIAAEQAKLREKAGIDAEWVVARLRLISDRCVQGEQVKDKDGIPTGEWKFDAAGANRATELLGKHLGMFREKVELTGRDGGPLEVEVSDARERLADRLFGKDPRPDSGGAG